VPFAVHLHINEIDANKSKRKSICRGTKMQMALATGDVAIEDIGFHLSDSQRWRKKVPLSGKIVFSFSRWRDKDGAGILAMSIGTHRPTPKKGQKSTT
jgi:hypothetical protein